MRAWPGGVDGHSVGGSETEFDTVGFFWWRDIELAIEKQIHLMQPRPHHRFTNIQGVLHPVNVADFVTVEGRNGRLQNSKFLQNELDDDFGIEMKCPSIAFEGQLRQRVRRIQTITRVKF